MLPIFKNTNPDESEQLNPSWIDRTGVFTQEMRPEYVEQVLISAESGNLGYLFDLYFKMIATDARVGGLTNQLRLSCSEFDYSITAGNSENAQSAMVAEMVRENLEQLNVPELKRKLIDGVFYGYALFEKQWEQQQGKAVISGIRQVSQARLGFERIGLDGHKFGEPTVKLDNGLPVRISAFNPEKLIPSIYNNMAGYYDLTGMLRPVVRYYTIKYYIEKFWAQFAETYGYPIALLETTQSDYDKNKGLIKQFLKALGRNKWMAMMPNWKLDLKEPMRTSTIETFKELITYCDKNISIAILGQDMITDGDGGSYGKAKVGEQLFEQRVDSIIQFMDNVINTYIVDSIVRVNYPTLDYMLYPKFSTTIDRGTDLREEAEAIRSALNIPGMKIEQSYVYDRLGIPMPGENAKDFFEATRSLLDEIDSSI